jgi:hypothetical protein
MHVYCLQDQGDSFMGCISKTLLGFDMKPFDADEFTNLSLLSLHSTSTLCIRIYEL